MNTYDEYGIPGAGNVGRFQYTGQAWLPELGMYYYKVRMYSPTLGRFMQTDPIGYGDGMNLYNYVGGDPVNLTDPSGMEKVWTCDAQGRCGWVDDNTITLTGKREGSCDVRAGCRLGDPDALKNQPTIPRSDPTPQPEDIVVTAQLKPKKNKGDVGKCLKSTAIAALAGALTPASTIIDMGTQINDAYNRTSRNDDLLQSNEKRGPRIKRSLGIATAVGLSRFVNSLFASPQRRVATGGLAAVYNVLSDPNCGINALPQTPNILPPGF